MSVLLVVLLFVALPCMAHEPAHDLRLGAGGDIVHERGTAMASLGGIVVQDTDEALGTHLNFLLRASCCGRRLCLSFAHLSHGAQLGIRRDAANGGLNFLFLESRLAE